MSAPLRSIILAATGQDVRKCWHCSFCSESLHEEQDLSIEMLLQMVLMNDDEVLTSRTLWSDRVLATARHLCANGLDVEAVLLALRGEAVRRGVAAVAGGREA